MDVLHLDASNAEQAHAWNGDEGRYWAEHADLFDKAVARYRQPAISRTGTMFFADPRAAFANIARALRPGGRLIQLVWRTPADNAWFLRVTHALAAGRGFPAPPAQAPGPFALSDPDRDRALLAGAGFGVIEMQALDEPMWFGPDAEAALTFFTGLLSWMLNGLDPSARARAHDDLRTLLAAHLGPDGVQLASAAWLITATR